MWTKEKLEEFLKDMDRTVDIDEYLLMIEFINEIKPDTIIDIGTFLGASGFILATCCDSIKHSYSIDNTESQEYFDKPEATKEEHGKYLYPDTIFLKKGYSDGVLDSLIEKHPDAFVFWDAGKNSLKVMDQIRTSHKNKIKYIALHDSGKVQKSVRRAIKMAEKVGMYKIIRENINSCEEKGITIMELI